MRELELVALVTDVKGKQSNNMGTVLINTMALRI